MDVTMPRTWMRASQALIYAHRQTGLQYAVAAATFDAPTGPFKINEAIGVEAMVNRVAAATDCEVRWVEGVAVFDPHVDTSLLKSVSTSGWKVSPVASKVASSGASRLEQLTALGHSAAIGELSAFAGSKDASTRLHALAALCRLEGDFMRNTWPGRLSIYEVFAEKLDRDALLYALEEGGALGGRLWKMAAEILGRARERVLTRSMWWNIWNKREGTVQMTLWCMARCGDPSGRSSLRKRIRKTFTNSATDRYLAAIALGEMDAVSTLGQHVNDANVDVRRAAAMGLGLCKSTDAAAKALESSLKDKDAAVQFVACQSLGRLGKGKALRAIVRAKGKPDALRVAALQAMAERPNGEDLPALLDTEELAAGGPLAAAWMDVLGAIGSDRALGYLLKGLESGDRWVRSAAVAAIARRGSGGAIRQAVEFIRDNATDADQRIAGIMGLGRSLSPEAADPLFAIAGDVAQPKRLRRYAALALTRLAERAGQKKLEALVDPASEAFLPFAVRHVRFETAKETAAALIPLLTHGSRDAACAAAGNLAELGHGPAVRELLEGSDIFDNHTRMMHCWGAIRSEGAEATAALVTAAGNRRRLIRQGAAFALGSRITPAAVRALLALAVDENSGVRAAAAQSLGLSADAAAIPVLIRIAESDASERARVEAIRSLRMRDFASDPRVKEAFARLAGDGADAGVVDPNRATVAAQEAHTFALRKWAAAYEEDLIANLSYETTMCFDSYRNRVIMWGAHGRRYDSPQTGQTWFYDAGTNRWTRPLDSRQWPNGTCCDRQIVFDAANKLAVVPKYGAGGHGWVNGLRRNLSDSIPWVLDSRSDQWYPMRPTKHYGSLGQVGGSFDPRHGLSFWFWGKLAAYDGHANRWLRFRPEGPAPRKSNNSSAVFDPKTGRLIAIDSRSTWAFDPAANKWTDLKPTGDAAPTGAPMVYDSVNDVMLALKQFGSDPMRVWVYHIRQNRWEKLAEVTPAPRYGTMFDCTYDPKHNVVVISGNELASWSGALTVRETWTYRYKPGGEKVQLDDAPRDVQVVTADDGSATVTWTAPRGGGVSGYTVLRKVADQPAAGTWEEIAPLDADARTYTDKAAGGKQLTFYAVIAKRGEQSSAASLPARTAAAAPRWATAVVTEGGVRITWQPATAEDVIGYHLYRATAKLGNPWSDRFEVNSDLGEWKRITAEPVAATELLDEAAEIVGPADELTWPKTYAYLVRPVNAWSVEGGASPVTPVLPDAPGPVRVIPWLDGRRLIVWGPSRVDGDVRGYHVMRMDDWHPKYVFRWQAAPVAGGAFFDDEPSPRADRRRYYVSGVDRLGTVGVPSSGVWSHGLP